MIGMSVLTFLCSFCWISSALLLAQGVLWLNASASAATMASAKSVSTTVALNQCCGGPLVGIKNLGIASLVFACLEVSLACVFLGFGANYVMKPWEWVGDSVAFFVHGGWPNSCSNYDCSVTLSTRPSYAPCFTSQYFSCFDPAILPQSSLALLSWALFYAGSTIVGGAFIISMNVATLRLLRTLAAIPFENEKFTEATANPVFPGIQMVSWASKEACVVRTR